LGGQVGHHATVTPASRGPKARSRERARLALVAAGLALTWTLAAHADSPAPGSLAEARALFAAAVADEQAGRWSDALVKIRRASAVKLTPGLRFHIALCDEKLGHLLAARDEYAAAEAAAQAESNREVLDLVIEPLASLKVRIPTITVNLPARFAHGGAGTEVRIDGSIIAATSVGAAVPVDVGSHTIQAHAPGQTPYAMTLTVVERQAATIDIQFLPLEMPGTLAAIVAPAPQAPPAATPRATSADTTAPHRSHTLAIAATAGGVVLLAGGIGAYAIAGSDQSDYQSACSGKPSPPCGNATAVRAWDAVALGAWIAAAGAEVVAVVLWASPEKKDSPHAELRGGPGTLSLVGTF